MPPEHLQGFFKRVNALPPAAESLNVEISPPARQTVGDVAVISVRGTLLKTVPAVYRLWGLNVTGYNDITNQINEAAADPTVKKIRLSIESPGGQVAGVQEAADAIAAANAVKPVTAVIEDLCCSGAYYLASQAGKIEANPNAIIGSIGVYSVFYDTSKMAENEGIRAVVISSGPHKGMGVPGTSITDEQIAAYQGIIDGMAKSFKAAVQSGRQLTDEQIEAVSTGQVWLSPQAKSFGLIDKITNSTTLKKGAKTMAETNETPAATVAATQPPQKTAATITQLKQAFPNHLSFAIEQCEAGASLLEAKAAFADILTADNAALQAQVVEAGKKSVPDGVPPIAAGGEGGSTAGDFITLAKERASEKNITLAAAMSAIASEQPKVYQAYRAVCTQIKTPLKDKDAE
jgi:signal peptide peptidase SppA